MSTEHSVCVESTEDSVCVASTEHSVCVGSTEDNVCVTSSENTVCVTSTEHSVCVGSSEDNVCVTSTEDSVCVSACRRGRYGPNCEFRCNCENSASCDAVTGTCVCQEGWIGPRCSQNKGMSRECHTYREHLLQGIVSLRW